MINRNANESALQYYSRIKDAVSAGEIDLDKSEIYNLIFGEVVSSDYARRAFRNFDLLLEADSFVSNETNHDNKLIQSKSTIEINKDGSQSSSKLIEMSEYDSKNPEFLLKAHGYDENWEIIGAKSSIWNINSKNDGILELYSSKITVKPKKNEVNLEYVKNILIENCKKYRNIETPITKIKNNNQILEVNISDLHLGKLAWAGECGENYDYKIASERFKYIISDILKQVEHLEFEKIIFIWSNDFYHFDTIGGTTTSGTPLDTDLRWQKLFRIGVELLVWAIDVLSNKSVVETFYIGSNHDRMTAYYATNYLYAWYKDNPNVNVSYDCIARKYIEYGNVMLGYCHGADEGKNINNIMAKEKPEIFGRTKFRYIHAAHYHSMQGKSIIEDGGCTVSYLGSPTGTDSWHYIKGYIGAIKCGYGFVYDKVLGQRLEIRSNIM